MEKMKRRGGEKERRREGEEEKREGGEEERRRRREGEWERRRGGEEESGRGGEGGAAVHCGKAAAEEQAMTTQKLYLLGAGQGGRGLEFVSMGPHLKTDSNTVTSPRATATPLAARPRGGEPMGRRERA
ncbi:hypothetical protein NHX12_011300 [Muraenolepis orangiensis]|uniref:Uncharacterized protein n=1 Tax=Muraenolepis orangiensis TaxID=630683 RepID=A0A9Q0DHL2_9TELE|nr:hypothetical protein NHX12_011300 [Muraenolepis orangiensis]